MFFKIIPDKTKIDFLSIRHFTFAISGILLLASCALFFMRGLNYGIDFKGGTILEIKTDTPEINLQDLRAILNKLDLGDVQVQEFGAPNNVLIRIEKQSGESAAQQKMIATVKGALEANMGAVDYRRVEFVGPQISAELARSALYAVSIALVCMLIYIWLRFEWQFSVGSCVALLHDVILTIGFYSLVGLEFNLSTIAAILTIVGYSMNDTVVVYDRVRENLRKFKQAPIIEILNKSINDTLSRTSITSITTFLALFVLYVWGGEVIRSFTSGMIFGVIVGTYSSIFIASPILLLLKVEYTVNEEDGLSQNDIQRKA